MHPIHYSLILNLMVLVVMGLLAFDLKEPLLVIVALLLANHSLARFQEEDDDDDDEGQAMGFTADVK